MTITTKPLRELVAANLMCREVVVIPEGMPLRDAAALLLRLRVSGAPVVDATGRCIGVLSSADFLRAVGREQPPQPPYPLACTHQTDCRLSDGGVVTLCTQAPGTCSVQRGDAGLQVCREPHSVLTEWQIVDLEALPVDEVRGFMTPEPVTTEPATPIHTLARKMIDAHIHRLIVVDEDRRPVGIVSSTDLLAALAASEG